MANKADKADKKARKPVTAPEVLAIPAVLAVPEVLEVLVSELPVPAAPESSEVADLVGSAVQHLTDDPTLDVRGASIPVVPGTTVDPRDVSFTFTEEMKKEHSLGFGAGGVFSAKHKLVKWSSLKGVATRRLSVEEIIGTPILEGKEKGKIGVTIDSATFDSFVEEIRAARSNRPSEPQTSHSNVRRERPPFRVQADPLQNMALTIRWEFKRLADWDKLNHTQREEFRATLTTIQGRLELAVIRPKSVKVDELQGELNSYIAAVNMVPFLGRVAYARRKLEDLHGSVDAGNFNLLREEVDGAESSAKNGDLATATKTVDEAIDSIMRLLNLLIKPGAQSTRGGGQNRSGGQRPSVQPPVKGGATIGERVEAQRR